ncbi:MarR family transcriptional regulator [Shewanella cyperi]|uniref:MarR family transcriptional regulator n=1 Tax=Shewanella cyperi TaxID=2814292 RepID=A0A974XTE3_9GAMM|nr:MarR family transcriptional regulator [Shewanella cyperi]QSX30039.1 MarR family transcriptional regulator [Shewanella cyperi]
MDAIDRIQAQWAAEKPALDTLPMGIIGRLGRLAKHLEQQLSACHQEFDLKPGEFDVLATLRRAGAPHRLTPSGLLQTMMLTSGAMTNRLDRLEQKGLIAREHSQSDRRSVEVVLTYAGLTLVEQVLDAHVRQQQALLASLPRKEQQQLNGLLTLWLAQFEQPLTSGD